MALHNQHNMTKVSSVFLNIRNSWKLFEGGNLEKHYQASCQGEGLEA